eukprot:TRINITY_DN71121_c0_g1_i1.p1 TRINITY_DN71121_c0_g1~~TRINITY_DN71121_c0_g1_i1.p1  ORF type:complete len:645 (+),score=116.02 TRINITY_DN71121_c0_g1_i1:75-1937(+)
MATTPPAARGADRSPWASPRAGVVPPRCLTPTGSARLPPPLRDSTSQVQRISLHCPLTPPARGTFGSATRFSGASRCGAQWLSPPRLRPHRATQPAPAGEAAAAAAAGPQADERTASATPQTPPASHTAARAALRSVTPPSRRCAAPRTPPAAASGAARRSRSHSPSVTGVASRRSHSPSVAAGVASRRGGSPRPSGRAGRDSKPPWRPGGSPPRQPSPRPQSRSQRSQRRAATPTQAARPAGARRSATPQQRPPRESATSFGRAPAVVPRYCTQLLRSRAPAARSPPRQRASATSTATAPPQARPPSPRPSVSVVRPAPTPQIARSDSSIPAVLARAAPRWGELHQRSRLTGSLHAPRGAPPAGAAAAGPAVPRVAPAARPAPRWRDELREVRAQAHPRPPHAALRSGAPLAAAAPAAAPPPEALEPPAVPASPPAAVGPGGGGGTPHAAGGAEVRAADEQTPPAGGSPVVRARTEPQQQQPGEMANGGLPSVEPPAVGGSCSSPTPHPPEPARPLSPPKLHARDAEYAAIVDQLRSSLARARTPPSTAHELSQELGALSTSLLRLTPMGGSDGDVDGAALLEIAHQAQQTVLLASARLHALSEALQGAGEEPSECAVP